MGEDQGVREDQTAALEHDRIYPSAIRALESELIRTRREAAGLDEGSLGGDAIGVAVSGGGIRSATFALGVFQALARANLLRRFDYLSTVSGGGYFGAFLGALYRRIHEIIPNAPTRVSRSSRSGAPNAVDHVRAVLQDSSHPAIDHLRQNGQYLAPASADRVLFGAVLLRNWLALMLVIAVLLLTVSLGFEVLWVLTRSGMEALDADFFELWLDPKLVLSPWLLLAGIALIVAVPLGWAYWILDQFAWWSALAGSVIATGLIVGLASYRELPDELVWLAGGVGAAASSVAMGLTMWAHYRSHGEGQRKRLNGDSWARHTVSNQLKSVLVLLGVCLLLSATDSLGRYLYQYFAGDSWTFGKILVGVWTFLLSVVPFASKLVAALGGKHKGEQPAPPVNLIVTLSASAILFLCLTTTSIVTQILSRDPKEEMFSYQFPAEALCPSLWAFAIFFGLSLLIGWTHSLLNRSTQLPLYSARITRAYLGASNPRRYRRSDREEASSKPHPSAATSLRDDDDIPAVDFFGWKREEKSTAWHNGGPLHIINTTLNETIDGRTKAHELDRKGLGLAIGPHGLSLGVRHHLTFEKEPPANSTPKGFSVFTGSRAKVPEAGMLSLGLWASISGAAFSTGLGARTRAAFSFLAGLTNVRLGHWWFAPQTRFKRPWVALPFWVQSYLLRELSARFPGTANPFWYLSDGGHFENMGGYELIRRRLPFILIIDGEADPKHTYEGLANLVRKARLDFGAEIEFMERPEHELDLPPDVECPVGPLEKLKPEGERRLSPKQASLAKISYGPGEWGVDQGYLLYIKATLFSSIPADLRQYADEHGSFPQETTIDQFFDEAQWESYRKLGELIGEKLLSMPRAALDRLLCGPSRALHDR